MKGNKPKTLEENQNIQMLMDERKINSLEDINKIIGKLNEIAKFMDFQIFKNSLFYFIHIIIISIRKPNVLQNLFNYQKLC